MTRAESTFSNGLELGALGERVRARRRELGATLDDLAERAGVSRSMVSDIERGAKVPTVIVFDRIAAALGTTIAELLAVARPRRVTVRRRGEQEIARGPTGDECRVLAPASPERPGELTHLLLPPGASTGTRAPAPPGSHCALVVGSGALRLIVADEEQALQVGDSATFADDCPHTFANPGTEPCSVYLMRHRPAPPAIAEATG
jgi:transcriptional regulator with XRE-family HTH domain